MREALAEFILSAPGAPFVRISGRAACKPLPRGQLCECVCASTVYIRLYHYYCCGDYYCAVQPSMSRGCWPAAARDAGREMMMHQEQSLSLCLFLYVCVPQQHRRERDFNSRVREDDWQAVSDSPLPIGQERQPGAYLAGNGRSSFSQHSLSQRARVYDVVLLGAALWWDYAASWTFVHLFKLNYVPIHPSPRATKLHNGRDAIWWRWRWMGQRGFSPQTFMVCSVRCLLLLLCNKMGQFKSTRIWHFSASTL